MEMRMELEPSSLVRRTVRVSPLLLRLPEKTPATEGAAVGCRERKALRLPTMTSRAPGAMKRAEGWAEEKRKETASAR
jgi:hypothetical protein